MQLHEIEAVLESQESFTSYVEEGGEQGMTLGLILDITNQDGASLTDEECLVLIEQVITYWKGLTNE
jgi:homospermidine synthase